METTSNVPGAKWLLSHTLRKMWFRKFALSECSLFFTLKSDLKHFFLRRKDFSTIRNGIRHCQEHCVQLEGEKDSVFPQSNSRIFPESVCLGRFKLNIILDDPES